MAERWADTQGQAYGGTRREREARERQNLLDYALGQADRLVVFLEDEARGIDECHAMAVKVQGALLACGASPKVVNGNGVGK